MKVTYICISHKPIIQKTTGGIETFSIYLLQNLKKLGIDITLYTAEETDFTLFPDVNIRHTFSIAHDFASEENVSDHKRFALNYSMFQYAAFTKAYLKGDYDIIHFSCAQWYIPFLLNQRAETNIISTVHVNNLRTEPLHYLLDNFKGPYIANISDFSSKPFIETQKKRTIYNGIDINNFPYNDKPDEYFAWLGRISPVKGLKEALLSANLAGVNLIGSGSIDYLDYYTKEIQPLLNQGRKVINPLSINDKGQFLSKAKAVLMPVMWDEPFGLVAIEAMACGTPVIAFRKGGLKETIVDGITGYLVDTIEEMAEKIKMVNQIDRKKCREHVEKHFTAEIMAKNYAAYYQEIIKNNNL